MRTALLITPSIDEIRLQAAKIGLPEVEADLFFYFYQSKGWIVGKIRMKCWTSALSGWKLRWQKDQAAKSPTKHHDLDFDREHKQTMKRISKL